MYIFESAEPIKKKPVTPPKNIPPKSRGELDGYTFTHHVDTFSNGRPVTEEETETSESDQ
jgi:hypothetical protein